MADEREREREKERERESQCLEGCISEREKWREGGESRVAYVRQEGQ